MSLKAVNLSVREGEILAIAGIAGNGQSELFDAISGERTCPTPDQVRIANQPCGHRGVTERRLLGAAFVPEERLGHGAVPPFDLAENVLLTRHTVEPGLVRRGFVNRALAEQTMARVSADFDVRTSRPNPEAAALSGGNLQKFVVGRELDRKPRLAVFNQPTWGVDAGAAALIRQSLVDLARDNAAVLMISQDLDEIFEVAHRVAVISRGELSDTFPTHSIDRERLGLLMAGAHEQSASMDA